MTEDTTVGYGAPPDLLVINLVRKLSLFAVVALVGFLFATETSSADDEIRFVVQNRPFILSVGQVDRRPTVTWDLPLGVESYGAFVSRDQAVDFFGSLSNKVVNEGLAPSAKSWTASTPLEPGTYFLQIVGKDRLCDFPVLNFLNLFTCNPRPPSLVQTVVIPEPPPPPPPSPPALVVLGAVISPDVVIPNAGAAVPGSRFGVAIEVYRDDTGQTVRAGNVRCSARVGKKVLRASSRGYRGSWAVCVWRLPDSSGGKRVHGSISVRVTGMLPAIESFNVKIAKGTG